MRKTQRTKTFLKTRLAFALFAAFKKTAEAEELIRRLEAEKEKTGRRRIRCPLCGWQPDASSRWFCADCDAPEYFYGGCGTVWNTFETGGRCPGCGHRWRWTSCLRCAGWARHDDWYEQTPDQGF
jgi:rubrerythrin